MTTNSRRVVVIGAGAAGLMAAAEAATRGADVVLLEKSSKTGVKILMSGGTRCNLTHDTDAPGITKEFGHAQRFLQPSVGAFPPTDVVAMFNSAGLATKVESTGKVFPESNRAVHVRDLLHRRAIDSGVMIRTGTSVSAIDKPDQHWIVHTDGGAFDADRVIVTVGGQSYPGCGTTGDGYQWLRALGHKIVPTRPALVPLVGGTDWTRELSGVTLDDVVLKVVLPSNKRPIAARQGSLLFTHFGFSGPAAMDVSGAVTAADSFEAIHLNADLIPNETDDSLDAVLADRRDGRRSIATIVNQWLPSRLTKALIHQTECDRPLAELPRRNALRLINHLKRLPIPVTGTRGFPKAEVTAGGVALNQVNPRTLESRICDGLHIAGEVLDVDGPIGGYNFQAAFSTGRAAGIAAADISTTLT